MLSRRTLLVTAAASALFALDPLRAFAEAPERKLSLANPHTGEAFDDIYWAKGDYLPDALAQLDRLLRDFHNDKIVPIDPTLIDTLAKLRYRLTLAEPIQIMSGYRSPETNAAVRRHNHNAARNSYHMQGMAVDISVPRLSLRKLRRAAIEMRAGGVGTYPGGQFIHLDVGPVRTW